MWIIEMFCMVNVRLLMWLMKKNEKRWWERKWWWWKYGWIGCLVELSSHHITQERQSHTNEIRGCAHNIQYPFKTANFCPFPIIFGPTSSTFCMHLLHIFFFCFYYALIIFFHFLISSYCIKCFQFIFYFLFYIN